MAHEKAHTGKFSLKDLMHDTLGLTKLNIFALLKFMVFRPKTWYQFLPIWYDSKDKTIVADPNVLIALVGMLLFVGVVILLT